MVVRVQSIDPELNLSELSVCRTEQTPSPDKFVRAQRLPSRANAAWIPIRDPCPIGTQARTTMDPDSGSMVVRPWSWEK